MRIIARAEWLARPPKETPTKITTPTSELWLHHAAGAVLPGDDSVSSADLTRIRSIQNYHMDVRGWNDIAYSFLVDPDGWVFEGRGAGVAGAHTQNHNSISHGICVMGNYKTQAVGPDLVDRLAELVRYGHEQGWWPAVLSGGHKDASGASTSCPGKNLYPLIGKINTLAEGGDDDMPLSNEDLQKIADAVWFRLVTHPVTGEKRGAQALLADAVKFAADAAAKPVGPGATPDQIADELAQRLAQ